MFITVTQLSMDFILIDNGESQRKGHGTLCIIFNELERDGYIMVGAGGSDQLVFVFHKPGLAEEKKEQKDECNTNDAKEEEKKEGKDKKDKKEKKDKSEKKTDDDKEKTDGASSPSRKEAKHRHSEKKSDKGAQ